MLKLVVLSLETANHPVMIGLLITVALPNGLDEPIKQALIDRDSLDHLPQLPLETLLPGRRPLAWPVIACAVVVNIFALLDLRGDGTSAKGASEHADERKLALCLLGMISLSERLLRLLPQGMGDNGGMATVRELTVPEKIPVIDRILEDKFDCALGSSLRILKGQSLGFHYLPRHVPDLQKRIIARRIPFEELPNKRSNLRIKLNPPCG
jgi:hypothetical protein